MGEVPAREVLWNITGHWLIYPCFIAALAVAAVALLLCFALGRAALAPVEDRRARESLR